MAIPARIEYFLLGVAAAIGGLITLLWIGVAWLGQSTRKEACLHEFLGTITMSPKTCISTKARGSNMCKSGY